jgi:hypothetical protein
VKPANRRQELRPANEFAFAEPKLQELTFEIFITTATVEFNHNNGKSQLLNSAGGAQNFGQAISKNNICIRPNNWYHRFRIRQLVNFKAWKIFS